MAGDERVGAARPAQRRARSAGPSRTVAAFLLAGLATACLLTLALPWLKTGAAHRSAFAVAGALRRAGLVRDRAAKGYVLAIAVVPGAAAATWILALTGYPRWSALLAAVAGGAVTAAALGVRHVDRAGALPGTAMAAALGSITLAVGLVTLFWGAVVPPGRPWREP